MEGNAETTPFLIFRVHDSHYAVEATAVREVVPLPEIYRLEETPSYIAGVVNLRGRIVPIIDLLLRFGYSSQANSITDSILVLEHADKVVGILVNDVQIGDIGEEEVVSESVYELKTEEVREAPFLRGVIKWGDKVAMRVHLENVLELSLDPGAQPGALPSPAVKFHYTEEENVVFRDRAHRLAQPAEEEGLAERLALAVVRVGREFFGIELHTIREFVDLRHVAPIPCCPPHIVGQTSLRGDLITVIDIADALGLPPRSDVEDRQLMVMQDPQLAAGVIVDELLNVLYLPVADVDSLPSTNRKGANELGRDHLRGTTTHGSRTLTLIDLPALLKHESLHVNENPL